MWAGGLYAIISVGFVIIKTEKLRELNSLKYSKKVTYFLIFLKYSKKFPERMDDDILTI